MRELISRLNIGLRRRLPTILQTEASECSLASIAMIANFYGQHTDLAQLRRHFGLSLKGATLRDIVQIADHLGFAARPLRLELEELGQLRLPCILHWDLNHFVVLESVGPRTAVIHDPAVGLRKLSLSVVSRHFTGIALELTPTAHFEPAASAPKVRASQLLGRLAGVKKALGHLFVLALAIEVFAMISPLFLGWIIDNTLVSADRDLLITLILGFALLLILQTGVSTMRAWMLMGLSASLKIQSRANLFSHLINLPTSFFEARHLGDVMSRFGSQETILQAITTELVEAVLDGLLAGLTLAIMFAFAPALAWIVVAGALIYGLLRWASYSPLRQASAEAIVWAARRDSHFLETLRGIRTIKLFNGQEDRRTHWLNLAVETINRQLTADKLRLFFRTARRLVVGAIAVLVIWLGALKVLEGGFSIGFLIAFIAYKDQFLDRVSELINKAVDLKMLRLHAERLADIALTAPEPRQAALARTNDSHRPATIELRKVSYRYGEQEPLVLKDVSLRIEAGESVAIVGPSGCGKSTLLKVIAGLVRPTAGEVLVDGTPLDHVGLENYREMLGVVMQDDQLFAGSLADNISFFSDRPNPDRIIACAKMAAVHDDIVAMPMGFGTLIGDMGTVLSGGQKQRVLLARALYRAPSILLLDEATSHLDVERERAVNDALRNSLLTRIVIAHRPETIAASDRVVSLVDGVVSPEHESVPTITVRQRSRIAAQRIEAAE
jgi:ATP-binding cassette subfamily B protein RaxB